MKVEKMTILVLTLFLLNSSSLFGEALTLHAVQYPEEKKVNVDFDTSNFGAGARLAGKVEYTKGQARITLEAENLSPAVLHGGEVSSYVLWAVTRTGSTENLGELWVWDGQEKGNYTTGLKELALLVTAEAHPLVDRPSELVVFRSRAVESRRTKSTELSFSDFAPAPAYDKESIAELQYTGEKPLFVIQAEKVLELARKQGAQGYSSQLYRDAEVALAQSRNLASSGKDELALDYARRSLALSSDALRLIARHREAAALEARILERRKDLRGLESENDKLTVQREELLRQIGKLEEEKAGLAASYQALAQDKKALERDNEALGRENQRLEGRVESLRGTAEGLHRDNLKLEESLSSALSAIAETRSTARGLIVTLPDILFDVDQATLKPDARTTLAKLAGVLQLVPEVDLEIEGHTDSTGTEAHNLDLSRRRAETVKGFLATEGVSQNRMTSRGFGEERPVVSNDTAEGREKNRRVEVILPRTEPPSRVSDVDLSGRKGGER